jgi:hypothetical protein
MAPNHPNWNLNRIKSLVVMTLLGDGQSNLDIQ